jgi:DNA end-binding protein Ku
MPARSIDTASISFGLVAIPVRVYATAEPAHEIHFHMIHAGCGKRVHQQLVCPEHGVVTRDQIAKGYEVSRGHTLELDPKELAALDAVANDAIEIREFVPADEVDPLFVAHSYYLGPGKGGHRAYRLLHDALDASELVAIAAYAARGKAYLVSLRPHETGIVMHQLHYADEIKPWSAIDLGELPKPVASELALAKTLIEQLRHDHFDPSHYKDDVKTRVRALLAEKAKTGEAIVHDEETAPQPRPADLMAALRASLGAAPARGAKPAHARARARPRVRATRAHARRRLRSA